MSEEESDLIKFSFAENIVDMIRFSRSIPVNFYSKEGQLIMGKKANASNAEMNDLLTLIKNGAYYHSEDSHYFEGLLAQSGDTGGSSNEAPSGFTDTKLISREKTEAFTTDVSDVFQDLRTTTFNSLHSNKARKQVTEMFEDFESQPDFKSGLVNIIQVLQGLDAAAEVELAVKRAVVAMALKSRGAVVESKAKQKQAWDSMSELMMAALFSHIGRVRMKFPTSKTLTKEQRAYISQYPLVSYLMLAHEKSIEDEIKHRILIHRRPHRDDGFSNNFPKKKWLAEYLKKGIMKYGEKGRADIQADMVKQLKLLAHDMHMADDANILSLASEFASLTSETEWREAFSEIDATRMIINNSLFSYNPRIMRQFLDYVSVSLANNERLIIDNSLLVLAVEDTKGNFHYEAAKVMNANPLQSKPEVMRVGYLNMEVDKEMLPKKIAYFPVDSFRECNRGAVYDLNRDLSRRIVFMPSEHEQPELVEIIQKHAKF